MKLYKIVHKATPASLEDAVQNFVDQGWEPVGGVSCSPTTVHEGSMVWAQALTREMGSEGSDRGRDDNWG
jgi:hypothetical protein